MGWMDEHSLGRVPVLYICTYKRTGVARLEADGGRAAVAGGPRWPRYIPYVVSIGIGRSDRVGRVLGPAARKETWPRSDTWSH